MTIFTVLSRGGIKTICLNEKFKYYLKEKRDKASLSVDKAFKAIDYLFNAKKTNAFESYNSEFRIGFYGGEPLLNFNFINIIVDYSKKRCPSNINLSFGMTTNGTLLEKHIDLSSLQVLNQHRLTCMF